MQSETLSKNVKFWERPNLTNWRRRQQRFRLVSWLWYLMAILSIALPYGSAHRNMSGMEFIISWTASLVICAISAYQAGDAMELAKSLRRKIARQAHG